MTEGPHKLVLEAEEWQIIQANDKRYMIFHSNDRCRFWATRSGEVRADCCYTCKTKIPDKIVLFHGVLAKL